MGNLEHKSMNCRNYASLTLQNDIVEQAKRRLALLEYFSSDKELNGSNLPIDSPTYLHSTNHFDEICEYLIYRSNKGLEFKNTVSGRDSNSLVIKSYEKKIVNIFNSHKIFSNEVIFDQITVCLLIFLFE